MSLQVNKPASFISIVVIISLQLVTPARFFSIDFIISMLLFKTNVPQLFFSTDFVSLHCRCQDKPFKVYVYPMDEHVPPSESYNKILTTLRQSNYFTSKPEEACLFVLSLDTLDRDPLSNFDFVRNMQSRFAKLELWNGGLNHVIFNLYSGTYPNYTEDLVWDFTISISMPRIHE